MKKLLKLVEEFHKKFGIPVGDTAGECDPSHQMLHYNLLIEEVREFKDAFEAGRKDKIADALGDVLFVLISSVLEHGLHKDGLFEEVFAEICESNLSKKLDGGEASVREDGKILKGKGYFPPRIVEIMERYDVKDIGGQDDNS